MSQSNRGTEQDDRPRGVRYPIQQAGLCRGRAVLVTELRAAQRPHRARSRRSLQSDQEHAADVQARARTDCGGRRARDRAQPLFGLRPAKELGRCGLRSCGRWNAGRALGRGRGRSIAGRLQERSADVRRSVSCVAAPHQWVEAVWPARGPGSTRNRPMGGFNG